MSTRQIKYIYDFSNFLALTFPSLYQPILNMIPNDILFADTCQDGGDGLDIFSERIYEDIKGSYNENDSIVLTDSFEYRENTIFLVAKKLIERKICSPSNLYVFLTTYPNENYISKMKELCNLYHLNFWIIRTIEENRTISPLDKVHNFMCLNNRTNISRMLMVDNLCALGYKKNVSWSGTQYLPEHNINNDAVLMHNKLRLELDYKVKFKFGENWMFDNFHIDGDIQKNTKNHTTDSPIYSSAINVVTETFFDTTVDSFDWFLPELNQDSSILVSEKTFKPMFSEQMFLIQGATGTLEYLKKLGFKTFSDYICEKYDNEPNLVLRTEMIAQEIHKLMQMNDVEWNELYKNITPILSYNRNHLLSLETSEKIILKL